MVSVSSVYILVSRIVDWLSNTIDSTGTLLHPLAHINCLSIQSKLRADAPFPLTTRNWIQNWVNRFDKMVASVHTRVFLADNAVFGFLVHLHYTAYGPKHFEQGSNC